MVASPRTDDQPAENGTAALVKAAAAGDRDAFGALYERFAPMVHAVLLSHATGDDVSDMVHDVFVTAIERLPSLRDPGAFGGWIAAIARNTARVARRRGMHLVALDSDVPAPAPSRDPLDGMSVLAAIRDLPEAYREPLMMRLVEGLGGNEIAARTGLTHGSVRVNLHRGMALLREKLGGGK